MKLINIPDISPADDDFTKLQLGESVTWLGFSGLPKNELERRVRPIRLSRYRGALEAARAAGPTDVIISHLPAMSVAVAGALGCLQKRNRHLAFAFNFTNLPRGLRKRAVARAARSIDQFTVFSRYEIGLYSNYFDCCPDKFQNLIWTQDKPQPSNFIHRPDASQYFCAIGGEGRDIRIVIECAKKHFPNFEFVIITRPHLIEDMSIPDNVTILTNLPLADTWAVAERSIAVLVPLDAEDRCCGHITLVSAKLMGLPIVTTDSPATIEYTSGRPSILKSQARNERDFSINLQRAIDERDELKMIAEKAAPLEREFHSRSKWECYLRNFLP